MHKGTACVTVPTRREINARLIRLERCRYMWGKGSKLKKVRVSNQKEFESATLIIPSIPVLT